MPHCITPLKKKNNNAGIIPETVPVTYLWIRGCYNLCHHYQFHHGDDDNDEFFKNLFYSFLVAKGLRYCPWAFSSCSEQGLFFTFHAQDSYCNGFSCCIAQTLDHWLSGCGTRACGIFLDQGLNQCPLHWQADS